MNAPAPPPPPATPRQVYGIRPGEYRGVTKRGRIPLNEPNIIAFLLTVEDTKYLWYLASTGVVMFGGDRWSPECMPDLFWNATQQLPGITAKKLGSALKMLAFLQAEQMEGRS